MTKKQSLPCKRMLPMADFAEMIVANYAKKVRQLGKELENFERMTKHLVEDTHKKRW